MPKSTKTQKSRIGEITLRLVQKDWQISIMSYQSQCEKVTP
jgi:hypothetical protein